MALCFHLLDPPPKTHPLSGYWQFWHVSRMFAKSAFLGSQAQEPGHCWVLCRRMLTLPPNYFLVNLGPKTHPNLSLTKPIMKFHLSTSGSQAIFWTSCYSLHPLIFHCCLDVHVQNHSCFLQIPRESLCVWIYASRLQEGSLNTQFLQSWFWTWSI